MNKLGSGHFGEDSAPQAHKHCILFRILHVDTIFCSHPGLLLHKQRKTTWELLQQIMNATVFYIIKLNIYNGNINYVFIIQCIPHHSFLILSVLFLIFPEFSKHSCSLIHGDSRHIRYLTLTLNSPIEFPLTFYYLMHALFEYLCLLFPHPTFLFCVPKT